MLSNMKYYRKRPRKLSQKDIEQMPLHEKQKLYRRLARAEVRRQAELRDAVRSGRKRQLYFGMPPEFQQSPVILRNRAQKAHKRALKYDPDSIYIDYELLMIDRPEKCPECKEPMPNEKELAITHFTPIERGGLHTLDNMRILHIKCHRAAVTTYRHIRKHNAQLKNESALLHSKKEWHLWSERYARKGQEGS